MHLTDAMRIRADLPPKEMDKHAFTSIVSWIAKIVAVHRQDEAMFVWLLQQTNEVDDGIATLLFTMARQLIEANQ